MSASTHWLVTGSNRGLGLGLVKSLLESPSNVVFATCRDPFKAQSLSDLQATSGGRLHVLKLSSSDVDEMKVAAQEVESKVGRIDVVVANAGIANYFGPVATTPLHEYTEHWQVNTLGIVILFQALYPLLLKSSSPKFVTISTGGARLSQVIPLPNGPYGSSKIAMNFVTCRIAQEEKEKGLIAFPLCPGWVATDLGNHGAKAFGLDAAPVTVEQSVTGMLKVIEGAGIEQSGRFWNFDGSEIAW